MSKYNYYILIACVALLGSSCKKSFLDVPERSSIARQDYVVDLKTTGDFLNGTYVLLAQNFYTGYNQVYPEIVADNVKPITTYYNFLTDHYKWVQLVNPNIISELWKSGYQVARSCNFVIEKASLYRDQSAAKADDLIGQAYALRALVYFTTVNVFAQSYNFTGDASHPGIPYIKTYDWTQPVSRQTVAEVYDNAIEDLKTALDLLPANPSNVSPASQYTLVMNQKAAKALLARIFLFKADYAKARDMAVAVGNEVPLLTGSDYPSKLFTLNEKEALFQVAPAISNGVTAYFTNFQGGYLYSGIVTQFLATSDVATLLTQDPNDARKAWISSGGTASDTIVKYPRNVIAGFSPVSASYYPTILRSSEMFLTAAESYAHLGNEDSARYYLNAIRIRANPSASPSTTTGSQLLEAIYTERRKELAFEGLRMFDLLRWKKPVDRVDIVNDAPTHLPYPNNKAIAPIPEMDVKLLGIAQNPGYSQ